MQRIDEDIKSGQYKTVYLLYGEESYLVNTYKNKLKSALVKEGDNMNVSFFEGAISDWGKIKDLSETMPFFAEKRVIFANNTGLFKGKGGSEDDSDETVEKEDTETDSEKADNKRESFSDYVKHIPESTCIVFTESKVDKRNKLYKAVAASGRAIEFKRCSPELLQKWIGARLKAANVSMKNDAYNLFIKSCGDDMQILSRELEKLICYTLGKNAITAEDVAAICTVQIEDKIFDMINAVADHDKKTALKVYDDMLALKTPPQKIMALLVGQFNKLYQVKLLKKAGNSPDTISDKVGLKKGYVTKLYMERSAKFKEEVLREALEECAMFDEMTKTGRMNDKLSIELIIIKYSDISLQK